MKNLLRQILIVACVTGIPVSAGAARVPVVNWQIPAPNLQASAWATWHNKVIPVPTKVDRTSKVRIGGTGGGLDLTIRWFIPFYYGILYEYIPVYSDTASPTVAGYGTVNTSANLYAHYFAGAIYVPLGDWIWELFLEPYAEKLGAFWVTVLRSPYGKASYGLHYMYATLTAGADSSTTSATRIGYALEGGVIFKVYEHIRVYAAYEYHSVYEDNYYLLGFKGGVSYRHRFGG